MKKIVFFIFFSLRILTFGEKQLIPIMEKGEDKTLIINLKVRQIKYYIKKGDTIKSIARRFKMSEKELIRRNSLKNEKDLEKREFIYVDATGVND